MNSLNYESKTIHIDDNIEGKTSLSYQKTHFLKIINKFKDVDVYLPSLKNFKSVEVIFEVNLNYLHFSKSTLNRLIINGENIKSFNIFLILSINELNLSNLSYTSILFPSIDIKSIIISNSKLKNLFFENLNNLTTLKIEKSTIENIKFHKNLIKIHMNDIKLNRYNKLDFQMINNPLTLEINNISNLKELILNLKVPKVHISIDEHEMEYNVLTEEKKDLTKEDIKKDYERHGYNTNNIKDLTHFIHIKKSETEVNFDFRKIPETSLISIKILN